MPSLAQLRLCKLYRIEMRGRAIISQKMASTEAKAGKPKANHLQNDGDIRPAMAAHA